MGKKTPTVWGTTNHFRIMALEDDWYIATQEFVPEKKSGQPPFWRYVVARNFSILTGPDRYMLPWVDHIGRKRTKFTSRQEAIEAALKDMEERKNRELNLSNKTHK